MCDRVCICDCVCMYDLWTHDTFALRRRSPRQTVFVSFFNLSPLSMSSTAFLRLGFEICDGQSLVRFSVFIFSQFLSLFLSSVCMLALNLSFSLVSAVSTFASWSHS